MSILWLWDECLSQPRIRNLDLGGLRQSGLAFDSSHVGTFNLAWWSDHLVTCDYLQCHYHWYWDCLGSPFLLRGFVEGFSLVKMALHSHYHSWSWSSVQRSPAVSGSASSLGESSSCWVSGCWSSSAWQTFPHCFLSVLFAARWGSGHRAIHWFAPDRASLCSRASRWKNEAQSQQQSCHSTSSLGMLLGASSTSLDCLTLIAVSLQSLPIQQQVLSLSSSLLTRRVAFIGTWVITIFVGSSWSWSDGYYLYATAGLAWCCFYRCFWAVDSRQCYWTFPPTGSPHRPTSH